jgi:CRP-like cAMP-binding protein
VSNKVWREVRIVERRINHIERKGSFGELALMEDAPRIASVRCVENCYFGVLNRMAFKKMLA